MVVKNELSKFLNDKILDYTKYVRNDDPKSISASQVGNELLQNYLIALFPNEPQIEMTQATFGSLLHGTMDTIFSGSSFDGGGSEPMIAKTEQSGSRLLPNGWTVTGTADIVMQDSDNRFIIDHKLTKIYAGKMFVKDPYTHQYTKQLNAYRYIFDGELSLPTTMLLNMMYKDADPLKDESAQELINVPEITDIEGMLVKVTDELSEAIDSGELPPRCSNLWTRTPTRGPYKDIKIEAKCEFYCSQNKICPYFTSKLSTITPTS